MADDQARLHQWVKDLLAPNTETIAAAETQVTEASKSPQWFIPASCGLLSNVADEGEAQMAATLLARCLAVRDSKNPANDSYLCLPEDQRTQLKAVLLQLFKTRGKVEGVRKAVGDLGARCLCDPYVADEDKATFVSLANTWPELLPTIREMVLQGNDMQTKAALQTLELVHMSISNIAAEVGKLIFSAISKESHDIKVEAAMTALFFIMNFSAEARKGFDTLLPPVMGVVEECLKLGDATGAERIIESLVNVTDSDSDILIASGHMSSILQAMYQVASSPTIPEKNRHQAVELMIVFAEADSLSCKKVPNLIPNLVMLLINMMKAEAEPTEEWLASGDDDEEEEEEGDSEIGAAGLDRLAIALSNTMERFAAPPLRELVNEQNRGDWRNRYACLKGLAHMAEGCKTSFEKYLKELAQIVLQHVGDEHPKVRHQAGKCLAQFCVDFAGDFQEQFNDEILAAINKMVSDPIIRVRHVGCACITNFCSDADPARYTGVVRPLLVTLYNLLGSETEKMAVKEQAMGGVSAVAENIGEEFAPYYAQFMPIVKLVLGIPENEDTQFIKAKAIECASFMAGAVGPELFLPDAAGVMDYMAFCMQNMTETDKRQDYIWQSWARLCPVAGEHFQRYIQLLIPRLLAQAVKEGDVLPDVGDRLPEGCEVIRLAQPGKADMQIAINTMLLAEKEQALGLLETFLESAPHLMSPYATEIFSAAKTCIQNVASDDVRGQAAMLCPMLMKCVKAQPQDTTEAVRNIMSELAPIMVQAIFEETTLRAAAIITESFAEMVTLAGEESIPREIHQKTFSGIRQMFFESLERRKDVSGTDATPNTTHAHTDPHTTQTRSRRRRRTSTSTRRTRRSLRRRPTSRTSSCSTPATALDSC